MLQGQQEVAWQGRQQLSGPIGDQAMVFPGIKLTPSFKLYGMLVAAMIAIAIIISAVIVLVFTKDFFNQHELANRKQALSDKAELISKQILFYRNIVRRQARKPSIVDIFLFENNEEAENWAANERRRLPNTIGVALFTNEGKILGNPRRQYIGPRCLVDMKKILRGQPISRPAVHSSRKGLEHFDLIAPVRDHGKVIGLLFISISLKSLQDNIKHLIKPGMSLLLRDKHGHIILRVGKNDSKKEMTKITHGIPMTGWSLVLYQVRPKLDKVYIAFGTVTALVVIVVMVLIITLMTSGVRVIAREFNTIQDLLRSVARGQTPENMPRPRIREVANVMPAIEGIAREIHDNHRKLKSLSLTDDLTGLPNRRHFQETLNHAIGLARRGMPVCVGLIDIDHFKQVNDTSGHDVGDQVLRVLAEVMRKHTRMSDFASRIGGDEFAVILYEMGRSDAKDWFNRLRRGMRDRTFKEGLCRTDLPCTLSCGFTYIDTNKDMDITMILRKADKALYKGKAQGRNKVVGI